MFHHFLTFSYHDPFIYSVCRGGCCCGGCLCTRGNANYCAWHSYGTCSGFVVQIGFFFNLDGDAGCNPQSNLDGTSAGVGSFTYSQGLNALANVAAHEMSEMRSDPLLNAWYDSKGSENGDKCSWTFPTTYETFFASSGPTTYGSVFPATTWKLQGEWSNAAYLSSTNALTPGLPLGCISSA